MVEFGVEGGVMGWVVRNVVERFEIIGEFYGVECVYGLGDRGVG